MALQAGRRLALAALLGIAALDRVAVAYPPAPSHIFYGMLRDEYGTPIDVPGAEVIMETSSGVRLKTTINPGIEVGANYRLEAPMDAGFLSTLYKPTALRPTAPFKIKVRIAGVTYLPIEMQGDYAKLGQPGQRTRLNLTLGEDSDGDGLPDAWERLINADISQVNPNSNAGNGLNYLQTYYAGTYAVDPANGFDLSIVGFNAGAPQLEFLAVTGRTYMVLGSSDLMEWRSIPFRVPAEGTNAPVRASFRTDAVKDVKLEVSVDESETPPTFFRLMLQ